MWFVKQDLWSQMASERNCEFPLPLLNRFQTKLKNHPQRSTSHVFFFPLYLTLLLFLFVPSFQSRIFEELLPVFHWPTSSHSPCLPLKHPHRKGRPVQHLLFHWWGAQRCVTYINCRLRIKSGGAWDEYLSTSSHDKAVHQRKLLSANVLNADDLSTGRSWEFVLLRLNFFRGAPSWLGHPEISGPVP